MLFLIVQTLTQWTDSTLCKGLLRNELIFSLLTSYNQEVKRLLTANQFTNH